MVNKMLLIPKSLILFFFTITCISLACPWEVIIKDPVLKYDDRALLEPLQQLQAPYIASYFSGKILDVQPIRDLSYAADLMIESITGISVHHLQNFILWLIIVSLLYSLLSILEIQYELNLMLTSLFAFNPCFWIVTSWISGRKHLLSTLFILWATNIFVERFKKSSFTIYSVVSIIVLYFLSCFSQPQNILWPFFVLSYILIYNKNSLRGHLTLLVGMSFVGFGTALLNLDYYSSKYVGSTGFTKFAANVDDETSFRLLATGRSFFQALISFWPTATPYYPGSVLNMIGIVLLVIFLYFFFKMKEKKLVPFLIYAFLPIAVVTIKMTNIFGSDTYLLNLIIGLYVILGLSIKSIYAQGFTRKIKKNGILLFTIFLFSYVYLSFHVAQSFQSDMKVFKRAYQVEPTPFNLKCLVINLRKEKNYEEALPLAIKLILWDPYGADNDFIFSNTVFQNQKLDLKTKLQNLNTGYQTARDLVWIRYYLAIVLASNKDYKDAIALMNTIESDEYREYEDAMPLVKKDFLNICNLDKNECKKIINNIKQAEQN